MEMKIAAFYCVWGDHDILKYSIKNIQKCVDGVIVIYSRYSNFGELDEEINFIEDVKYFHFEPNKDDKAAVNERAKRNFGLDKLRELGYTHFIMLDADEFYEPKAFKKELERFTNPNLKGLVCGLKCYFRTPKLYVNDHTLVTFIHKLTPELRLERNIDFPFAYDERMRIDPTRTLNIRDGVEWSEITMHHYSYIRSDLRKKIRNSTARKNLEASTILADYRNAKEEEFCQFYQDVLKPAKNIFRLPEMIDYTV